MFLDDFENLDIFTAGIFSDTAVIDGVEISGIFDEKHEPFFDTPIGGGAEGRRMTFKVQTSRVSTVGHGSTVELKNRIFEVVGKQPTSDGKITELMLKEVRRQKSEVRS